MLTPSGSGSRRHLCQRHLRREHARGSSLGMGKTTTPRPRLMPGRAVGSPDPDLQFRRSADVDLQLRRSADTHLQLRRARIDIL